MTQELLTEWKQAEQGFWRFINDYENLPQKVQKDIDIMLEGIEAHMSLLKEKQKAVERMRQRERAAVNRQRKKVRDEAIPQWCVDNLQPGIVVKVKAASSRLRLVQELGDVCPKWGGSLTGRHCHFSRTRDLNTNEITSKLKLGSYITDHTYTNVQGVVTGVDARGQPIVTTIMDLVEGRKDFNLTAALECAKLH